MFKVFLISGKAESGKDTLAQLLMAHSKINGSFYSLHIADNVKKFAKEHFGWNGVKDVRGRELLQLIGDGGREYNPNLWIEKFIKQIYEIYSSNDPSKDTLIVVPDVRYQNEVIELVSWCAENNAESVTIRIERPNHVNKLTEEQKANKSEVDLDDWGVWDYKIINDGTMNDLLSVARNILEVEHIESL